MCAGNFVVEQNNGKDRRCLKMFFVFVFPKLIEKKISIFFRFFYFYFLTDYFIRSICVN